MEGSLIAPPFKFGMQKQYRELREMDSRQKERAKAETTLKEGSPDKSVKLLPAPQGSKSTIQPSANAAEEEKMKL